MQPHPALSVIIAIVITVLTASFLFSVGNAFFVDPSYSDFCEGVGPYPDRFAGNASQDEIDEHERALNECQQEFNDARDGARNGVFFIVTGLAIVVIIGALAVRPARVDLTFYIVSGIIFGALAAILIATMQNWGSFARFVRPLVLLVEIVLVTFVAFKLFAPKKR